MRCWSLVYFSLFSTISCANSTMTSLLLFFETVRRSRIVLRKLGKKSEKNTTVNWHLIYLFGLNWWSNGTRARHNYMYVNSPKIEAFSVRSLWVSMEDAAVITKSATVEYLVTPRPENWMLTRCRRNSAIIKQDSYEPIFADASYKYWTGM